MVLPLIKSRKSLVVGCFFSVLLEAARAILIHRHERSSSALTDGRKETENQKETRTAK